MLYNSMLDVILSYYLLFLEWLEESVARDTL